MKYQLIHTCIARTSFALSLLLVGAIAKASSHGCLVVPAVLVHNQQRAIIDTLKPFIGSGITDFLLCGDSADKTIDIAKNFLQSAGACVNINNEKFDDDGTYYNHICSTVKTLFSEAEFCLLLNGQWLMHNAKALAEFCTRSQHDQCPVYWIKLATHGIDEESYKPCLARCRQPLEFKGIINPIPQYKTIAKVPSDVYFEWNRIQWGISKAKKELTDNTEKLLKAYTIHPHDPHLLFNMAGTYASLNDLKEAYTYYALSLDAQTGSEQDYVASYRLALLLDKISEDTGNWDLQYRYYVKAHEIRPWRAEPLVRIAQHYLHDGNNYLAFLFARQASLLKYPEPDTMAIERDAYEYTPFDILGITGWYVGEFEIGEQALRTALASRPYNNHLSTNLDFYIKRKESLCTKAHKTDPRIPSGFGVDFHDSMKHGYGYNYDTIEQDPFLKKIKSMYEKYTITDVQYLDAPRIPKIIHHIWLGSELPDRYKAWQQTWLIHHPDWQYWLWTQKDIDELGLKNRAQFDAALTYGEKSDIARYEILYKFGGVYTDSDFECIQPMDVFHHCCDFYAGLEGTTGVIGNSIIGSVAGHPIIKQCIDTLRGAEKGKEGWQYVVDRTGPGHVTSCVKAAIMTDELPTSRIVIFPACYFFPWYPMRPEPRPIENVIKSLRPETFALHLWESSWVK